MQSLMHIHCFLFEIHIIKNGFSGLIIYRVFRETGPSRTLSVNICSEDLLLTTIFGLKYDEKLEFSLPQIFVKWEK